MKADSKGNEADQGPVKMEVPLETLKSRLMSTSMRLDTSSPVLYTSASIADVQHPRLPLLLLLFLHMPCTPQASAPLVLCAHAQVKVTKSQSICRKPNVTRNVKSVYIHQTMTSCSRADMMTKAMGLCM